MRSVVKLGIAKAVPGDIGALVPDRQGGGGPYGPRVQIAQIHSFARRIGDRVIRPWGQQVFATVFRPDRAAAFGRDLKAEAGVGNDVDPGGGGGLAVFQHRHIGPAIISKTAKAIKKLKRRQSDRRGRLGQHNRTYRGG